MASEEAFPPAEPGSERDAARRAIIQSSTQQTEPQPLKDVFSEAHATQQELRERNRYRESMREMELSARAAEQRSELGLIGRLLGGKENAPVAIAAIATVSGIAGFFVCLHYAAYSSSPDRFTRYADASIGFAGVAIAYLFGRGSRQ